MPYPLHPDTSRPRMLRLVFLFVLIGWSLSMSVERESAKTRQVVVIGGGLAGLSTALETSRWIQNLPIRIMVVDKEPKLGGNSVKASSGINAAKENDEEAFMTDTIASGGGLSREALVETLVHKSKEAIQFLESFGVDLSGRTQLGGHSTKRTCFSPSGANVGFAIMKKLIEAVEADPKIDIRVNTNIAHLDVSERNGDPLFTLHLKDGGKIEADAVVITTGGFGANKTMLETYDMVASKYPTTNGPWSTGDGLALGKMVGALFVDLNEVQIHPTGFVDPKDPDAGSKILAAEKLRGSGAILLNMEGRRFVDELNRRDHVYEKIAKQTDEKAWLVLSSQGAEIYNVTQMGFYLGRGLITKVDSLDALSTFTKISANVLREEFEKYNSAAKDGKDAFGKTTFPSTFDLSAPFYVAKITPVVHYTMGGLSFDENARVLKGDGSPIPGLYAAGEVTGGLHGKNRLGGNSLLDCVVFGRQAGMHIGQSIGSKMIHEELK